MKKGGGLLLVLICLQVIVFVLDAQVQMDYISGSVVLASKDTLYGEIRQFPLNDRVRKVYFREKGTRDEKVYSAYDLLSFHFLPDVTYESFELPNYRQMDTTYTWYFALKRVAGAINLFKLNITSGEVRFFVQNAKYGLSELKYPIETINNQVFRDNRYMAVLGKYTSDVPSFQSRIASYAYDEKNLVALISEYNVRFGENKVPQAHFDWDPTWYISAGIINALIIKNINGFHFDLEYTLSNPKTPMWSEYVIGLNYKRLNYPNGNTKDSYVDFISLYSSDYSLSYNDLSSDHKPYGYSANIIGMPIFCRLNNRRSFISPVIEFGFEPYLFQTNLKSEGEPSIRTKLAAGMGVHYGLGLSVNYQRYRLRYMYSMDEIFCSSLTLQYKLW
jgi:hypothetical protein